jgi:hypothetical protein
MIGRCRSLISMGDLSLDTKMYEMLQKYKSEHWSEFSLMRIG